MPENDTRSTVLQVAAELLSGGANPAALLGKGQADSLIGKLVSHLQRPDYSVTDLFQDVAAAKEKIVAAGLPLKQLATQWSSLDRTIEECVERTLVAHEKFLGETLHGYCEFDPSGRITFANARMIEWLPNCVGKELAGLFGKMAPDVRKALAVNGKRRLHQLDLVSAGGHYSVLAEFGKIDARGPTSGYALLVDMSELVGAEHKALEASPYGMVKLDAKYRVLYANTRALEYLETSADDVIGRDPVDFVVREDRNEILRQRQKRSQGRGSEYPVRIERRRSHKEMHVRVTGVPSFGTSGQITGVLTALQPIDYEVARADTARLVATETDYRVLFDGIIKIVGKFVDFDWADLSLYTPKGDYAVSFCRFPETSREYPIKWWPILQFFRKWILEDCPCFADILVDLKKRPDGRRALKTTPEMEQVISADGRRALIALPIRRENRLVGALSLSSKKVGIYDKSTLDILKKQLAIEPAMLAILNLRERDEQQFVGELLKKISALKNHQDLARIIVVELARFYKFQNVSIFKVNSLRGHFSLLAQELGPDGGSAIPPRYTQRLDEGLLGLTLQRGKRVVMRDRKDRSVEARHFKQVAKEIVSELCIPVTFRGRILWILNLEDTHTNAFAEPEIATLEAIVSQVESIVEHLFQAMVLTEVIDSFPDGVVIASNGGNILLCNDTARGIFERSNTTRARLEKWLPNVDYERAVSEQTSLPWTTTIKGAKGKKTPVRMSKFLLAEEYDHVVLRIEDVSELQWKTDATRLEAALAEAASLVRVPLSLVSSYVRQMREKGGEDTSDLADKAFRQLSRVELTYDRVFAAYGSDEMPNEQKTKIDVNRVIEYILAELPKGERAMVKLASADEPLWVTAASYRLLFALESMLAYLVRLRASAAPITIEVSAAARKYVDVVLTGPVLAAQPNGELETLVEAMRTEIALGERLLGKIATESEGSFKRQRLADNRERLSLRLKLARY